MAHQDYSQICPIFKEGVEHDLFFPINLSQTVTAAPVFIYQPGREITIFEGYANAYLSTGKSVSASFSIQFFKSESLSITANTLFGSVGHGKVDMSNATFSVQAALGQSQTTASITSTNFTSTDVLFGVFVTEAPGGSGCMEPTLHIRYRDK